MKKIILCSFFNSNNIGDKAIADIFTKELSVFSNVTKCSNEGSFKIVEKYVSKNYSIIERLTIKFYKFIEKRYLSKEYKKFLAEFEKNAASSDAVVIGGGNVMMEYAPYSCPFEIYGDIVRIAKSCNIKIFSVSIGIGPFSTQYSRKRAIEILNSMDYVSFRDSYSYNLFLNNGGNHSIARKSVDPVLCGNFQNDKKNVISSSSKNNIGINLIYPIWKGKKYADDVIKSYCNIITAFLSQKDNVNITIFTTEKNDSEGLEYIASNFESNMQVTVQKPETLQELINIYNSIDYVIGARMHSLIIAFSNQIPVFGLAWEKKVNYFFEIIQMEDHVIDIEKIDDNIEQIMNIISNDDLNMWNFEKIYKFAKEQVKNDMEIIRNAV